MTIGIANKFAKFHAKRLDQSKNIPKRFRRGGDYFFLKHPIYQFFCGSKIFLYGQIYTKNYNFFRNFGAVNTHFESHNGGIWHDGADLGLPPQAKFCKNRLRGYTLLGKFILKISILAILGL